MIEAIFLFPALGVQPVNGGFDVLRIVSRWDILPSLYNDQGRIDSRLPDPDRLPLDRGIVTDGTVDIVFVWAAIESLEAFEKPAIGYFNALVLVVVDRIGRVRVNSCL